MRANVPGTIYLLHIEPRYRHAGHYLGWTEGSVDVRLQQHFNGKGSPLIKAALAAGCEITLVRTWQGDRHLERELKNKGSSTRYCPVCEAQWSAIRKMQNERRHNAIAA